MKERLLGKYINGNYSVSLGEYGTKIRETEEDEFIPAFAENCDCHITSKCDGGCEWCYANCTPNGQHASLNWKFFDTLHPYTELAINGNDMTHPELISFLHRLKEKKVIANLTVNQMHFERNEELIRELVNNRLIWGLGVSLKEPTEEFIAKIQQYPNAIIHVINGILTEDEVNAMKDKNLKLLILGYKTLCRGVSYLSNNNEVIKGKQDWLKNNLMDMINHFNVISFDNLAIEQLEVQKLLSPDEWEEFYMGDDGQFTFYLDLVKGTFARDSISDKHYPIMDNIDDMFRVIRSEQHD